MEIQLPEDLERYVDDEVRAGRFSTKEEVIKEALEHFKLAQMPAPVPAAADPWLGSMRDEAELLEVVVEEAMRARETRPWRLPDGE